MNILKITIKIDVRSCYFLAQNPSVAPHFAQNTSQSSHCGLESLNVSDISYYLSEI